MRIKKTGRTMRLTKQPMKKVDKSRVAMRTKTLTPNYASKYSQN